MAGDIVTVLSDASADADLLVVGSRGRGDLKSLVLGSVSHGCCSRPRCPVAVVHHPSTKGGPVVVGTDGTDEGTAAVQWAAPTAAAPQDVPAHRARVARRRRRWRSARWPSRPRRWSTRRPCDEAADAVVASARAVAGETAPGLEVTGSADEGIATEVLEAASKGAAMVVRRLARPRRPVGARDGIDEPRADPRRGLSRGLRPRLTELSADSRAGSSDPSTSVPRVPSASSDPARLLARVFGHPAFRPGQEPAVARRAGRPRRAGRDADRLRQVALLPAARARRPALHDRRLAAGGADAGPGRRRCGGSAATTWRRCRRPTTPSRAREMLDRLGDGDAAAALRRARAVRERALHARHRRRRGRPAGRRRGALPVASGATTSGPTTGASPASGTRSATRPRWR